MRQTDLTLERILQELSLEGNKSVYRPCMLVNEIGAIYNEKKDEESESESERALLALLEDKEPSYRAIAFCFLYSGSGDRVISNPPSRSFSR